MAHILIVDDDAGLRGALIEALASAGHSTIQAKDGREARNLIPLANPDLIISDLRMPHLDGLELLAWVKQSSRIPFILITGFSHILETEEAFRKGADGFITKPFTHMTILEAVSEALGIESQPTQLEREPRKDYCQLPIEDFVSSDGLHFNVYVRLSEDKYIRVAHQGDLIPSERADNYKAKGVRFLYIKKEDMAKVVGFNLKVASAVARSDKLSDEKKHSFIRYTVDTVLEDLKVNGINSNRFQNVKACVETSMSLISESQNLVNLLYLLNSHSSWVYSHCLGVGIYSVMIARQLGWRAPATCFKLFTAGLLHDVGKKEISPDLLAKPRHLLSHDETKQIETHPIRGKDILTGVKEVPGDIIQVIYEHHEDCIGSGFPRQIKRQFIHPLARIVSVSNQFCKYALKSPHSEGSNFSEAFNYIQREYGERLDTVALKALSQFPN